MTLEFNRYLFGSDNVFRFDMSEFLHLDNLKLFMGDETGRAGRLGNVLAHNERGVLLFDEIEKAHRLIWDLFLQMLDTARITLADHRAYDLSGSTSSAQATSGRIGFCVPLNFPSPHLNEQ